MDYDELMFAWRAIVLLATSIIFFIASRITSGNVAYETYYKEYYQRVNLLAIRQVIARSLFVLGVIIGALSIWELCANNPNEWLGMKMSFCIFVWSLFGITFFISLDIAPSSKKWKKLKPYFTTLIVLSVISIASAVGFAIYGGILHSSHPKIAVEREVISSTELLAVNDGQQINGSLHSSLFTTTFTISENGAYRYYYQAQNGSIKQGYVDADETDIYYTKEGETPHLDHLTSYTYSMHTLNNEPRKEKTDEKTWYELYVPEGSVVESYVFDLQ